MEFLEIKKEGDIVLVKRPKNSVRYKNVGNVPSDIYHGDDFHVFVYTINKSNPDPNQYTFRKVKDLGDGHAIDPTANSRDYIAILLYQNEVFTDNSVALRAASAKTKIKIKVSGSPIRP